MGEDMGKKMEFVKGAMLLTAQTGVSKARMLAPPLAVWL